ncbi:hypothetical protein H5J25_05850 [Sphingomonas aliaeris]|uniref:Alpha/beta hydrolase n=2 Tax=Sphingomonas aliaeris TaxID=2759526 RepID=A0A974S5W9_9SPHN|nr:hypothetical protein H5J25_05850 [Sphingomonas aliaeris]
MLRFGPETGPVVIASLPFFEEANRTRAFTVSILRRLAELGVASILPDYPGTGDSLIPTRALSLHDIQQAYTSVVRIIVSEGRNAYALGLRSSALIDREATLSGRWHLAPQSGAELIRDLNRVRIAQLDDPRGRSDSGLRPAPGQDHVIVAGNAIPASFLAELESCEPSPRQDTRHRIARLSTDTKTADVKLGGIALWRRSEPDSDIPFAQDVADDVASWIARCGG